MKKLPKEPRFVCSKALTRLTILFRKMGQIGTNEFITLLEPIKAVTKRPLNSKGKEVKGVLCRGLSTIVKTKDGNVLIRFNVSTTRVYWFKDNKWKDISPSIDLYDLNTG